MNKQEIAEVEGAYVITFDRHKDHRGYFEELFSSIRYDANLPHVAQVNLSYSKKWALRGLHVAHFCKLCTCIRGKLWDVVADVREGSPTYGKWYGLWLTEDSCDQLFVPAGCAHGILAYEDDTILLYQQDGLYTANMPERIINTHDPTLNIKWPPVNYYLSSQKDKYAPYLDGSPPNINPAAP